MVSLVGVVVVGIAVVASGDGGTAQFAAEASGSLMLNA